jgi:hypothetical protein
MNFLEKHKKAIIIAFFVFVATKIKNTSIMPNILKFTENDAKEALLKLSLINSTNAKIIERIYRLETNHFKSLQFKMTGSAGMEVGKWLGIPSNVKSVEMVENGTGLKKRFIVWASCYDFVTYLSNYIDRYNGNWSRWYSTESTKQNLYKTKVNSIKNRFIL